MLKLHNPRTPPRYIIKHQHSPRKEKRWLSLKVGQQENVNFSFLSVSFYRWWWRRRFPSLRINGMSSLASSTSSWVAILMQQYSKEAKKAVVTPSMNHMATPSGFPQPLPLFSPPFSVLFVDRRVNKLVVAAMVTVEVATARIRWWRFW